MHFGICVDNVIGFNSGKKFVTFSNFVQIFLPWKFKVNFQEFQIGQSMKSETFTLSNQSL
jgi:hypothetical protein